MTEPDLSQPSAAKHLGEKASVLFNKENDLVETLNRHGIHFDASTQVVSIEFLELSKSIGLMRLETKEELFKKTKSGEQRPPLRGEVRKYPDLDVAIRGTRHILEGYETELKDLREFIARIKGLRAELAAFKHVSEVGESKRVDALNAVNALAEEFGRKEDFRKKLAKEKLEHAAELIRQGKISRVWLVLDGAVNRAGSRITAINNTLKPKSLTRQALLENYKKEVEGQKNALAKTLLKHLHDSIGKAIDFQASVSKTADFTKKLVGFYGKKLSDIMNKTAVPNTQQNYYLKNIVAPKLFKQAKELKARTKAKKMLEAAELLENASKHMKNGAWNDARTALRAAYAKSNEVEKYGLLTEEHHRQLLENHDHLVYALSRRANEPKIGQVVELVKNSRTALEQKRFGPSHHYLLKAVENGV